MEKNWHSSIRRKDSEFQVCLSSCCLHALARQDNPVWHSLPLTSATPGCHISWLLLLPRPVPRPSGSEYKIDASYLSPNVNLASRLEAATKQFGVDILLSQDFVDCLSPRVRTRVSTYLFRV
jgi:hypothetical protein